MSDKTKDLEKINQRRTTMSENKTSTNALTCQLATGDLLNTLTEMDPEVFLKTIASVVKMRGSEELSLLISELEIRQTASAFTEDDPQLELLKQSLELNPLSFYLEQMGVNPQETTRSEVIDWWDTLMQMAANLGYNPGGIDTTSRETNLWKATASLARKMQATPASYRFLPAVLINHPSEVDRVLNEINEPEPFLEVLIGESYEDMKCFPELIGSLSILKRDGDISRTPEDGILSIHLILQRGIK